MAFVADKSGNGGNGLRPDPHLGRAHGVQALKPGATQVVTSSGTSQEIGPFDPGTKHVRIAPSASIYYDVGAAPVAVAGENLLVANAIETIALQYPQKIAIIQVSGAGNINFTEMR